VVDEFSILNPGGLRFADEFARHKVLDAMGDLALLGMPLIAAFTASRSGHALNQALVRKLLADRTTHEVVQIQTEEELEPLQIRLPALGVLDVA
jgi:UDP-3-O-[3-hydroxymyristoyl] N-acetylglucosamine deacetylase